MPKAALGRGFEDAAPVDDSLSDFGERSRTVVASGARWKAGFQILDVKLRETTGKTIEIIHRIFPGAHAPKAVELKIGELRIGTPKEFIVLDHSAHVGIIEVMAVVEEMATAFVDGLTHLVKPIGIALYGVERFPVLVIEAGEADVGNAAFAGVRNALIEMGFELLVGIMRAEWSQAIFNEQTFKFCRFLPVKIEGPAISTFR